MRCRLRWSTALAVVVALAPSDGRADDYAAGQHVQVREGDQWSAATITVREGRKYKVHYDTGTAADDEWVTTERLRRPDGSTPTPVTPTPATPVTPTPPVAPANGMRFSPKDHVEVKHALSWRKATVVNVNHGWYLIQYDDSRGDFGREWAESDRLRPIGSSDDPIGWATPHFYHRGDPPPAGPSTVGTEADQAARRQAERDSHRHDSAADEPDLTRPDATDGPGGHPLLKPDLSAGRDLEPTAVAAGPVPADPPPSVSPPRNLSLNHGTPQGGTAVGLLVTPQGRWGAVTYQSFTSPALIQRLELGSNDAGKVQTLAGNLMPLAISPDGKRLVTRSDRRIRADSRWRLDVWDVDAADPKPLLSFRPFDPAEGGADAIDWAAYLDATHVLTCSGKHVVTLWQIADGTGPTPAPPAAVREVYTLAGDDTVRPRLSGGGRYVVAGFDASVVVLDAMTGACVAKVPDPSAADDGVALRPDVKRLAMAGRRRLVVLDLEHGGAAVTDLGLPPDVLGAEVAWVRPDLLLIDDRLVYDVGRHRFVWAYQLPAGVQRTFGESLPRTVGDRVWYLTEAHESRPTGPGRSTISSAPCPDAQVAQAERSLADVPFAVAAGTAVSLDVSLSVGTDEERKAVADRFRRQLEANGATVADGQPVKLAVRTHDGKSRSETYRRRDQFGLGTGDAETVSATSTVYELSFEVGGKSVWELTSESGGTLPLFVRGKQGQSIADAVAAAEAKPTLDWFLSQRIPREVLADATPAGTSPLTGTGGRTRNGR